MKTKEFIKELNKIGYIACQGDGLIGVYGLESNDCYCDVDTTAEYSFNTLASVEFSDLSLDLKKELFDLVVEYVSTPVEEREEEKRYCLKHKWLVHGGGTNDYFYLNYNSNLECYFINGIGEFDEFKTKFTQKEIDEIKEKFNTDLKDFEMIEVEE